MADHTSEAALALKAMFEEGKARPVAQFLADDVELLPPTYGKAWKGAPLVERLLGFAAEAFGGLTYTAVWSGEDGHVMRFEGEIDGEAISGVDVVRVNAEGLIDRFEVFSRPPKAALQLREAMGARVRADAEVMGWMGLS